MYQNRQYWTLMHEELRGRLSAVGYVALGEGFNQETYRLRLGAVDRILRKANALPISRVLEGAVGVGAYGRLWKAICVSRWLGIDISRTAVADLQKRYPQHQFIELDLSKTDDPGWQEILGDFELVTAIDILYHLTDDAAFASAVRNLAGYVAVGGHLLISDVFVREVHQSSAHVRRRPLATYADILRPLGLDLVLREPVFAILGDPVPRPGFHPSDAALYTCWRILQKTLRISPKPFRTRLGSLAVRALAPIDMLLRRTGITKGINLELALFRRFS